MVEPHGALIAFDASKLSMTRLSVNSAALLSARLRR
ncbi:hypothetical protein [Variovorax paradoxus]